MKPRKGDSFYIIDRDGKRRRKIKRIGNAKALFFYGLNDSGIVSTLKPNKDKSSRVRWILNK